jgi:hypothetical protein
VSLPPGITVTLTFGDQALPTATPTGTRLPTATPATGEICALAFNDLNGNGQRDPEDPLLAGVKITVTNASGLVVCAYDTLGIAEPYCCPPLATGSYRVVAQLPAGYRFTTPDTRAVSLSPGIRLTVGFGARLIPTATPKEGVGIVEAPRGTLTHHYITDEHGVVKKVNLIVGTTNNIAPISTAIRQAAKGLIKKGEVINQGLLNLVEMAFRAYDPCMSCATHALPGSLPLEVRILDSAGQLVQRLSQGLD